MFRVGRHPAATVYLLHFEEGLACHTGAYQRRAQHYVGMTDNLVERMRAHVQGDGSRLVAALLRAGQTPLLVREWVCRSRTQARHVEWIIKRRTKNARTLCPICVPGARRRMEVSDERV